MARSADRKRIHTRSRRRGIRTPCPLRPPCRACRRPPTLTATAAIPPGEIRGGRHLPSYITRRGTIPPWGGTTARRPRSIRTRRTPRRTRACLRGCLLLRRGRRACRPRGPTAPLRRIIRALRRRTCDNEEGIGCSVFGQKYFLSLPSDQWPLPPCVVASVLVSLWYIIRVQRSSCLLSGKRLRFKITQMLAPTEALRVEGDHGSKTSLDRGGTVHELSAHFAS